MQIVRIGWIIISLYCPTIIVTTYSKIKTRSSNTFLCKGAPNPNINTYFKMNGSSKSIVVPSNGFPSTISTTPFDIENCYLFGDYCKKPLKSQTVSIISNDSSETNDNGRSIKSFV